MAGPSLIPAGDFRTTYAADTTIFPTRTSRNFAIVGVALLCFAPQFFSGYSLSILIQIGIFSTDGTFDPKAVAALKQSFIEMGLLKEIPDDKVMFTTQFVPVKTGM